MIKIAIIIERSDISLGGAERSVLELTSQLNSLHAEVHLLAAKGKSNTENVHILLDDNSAKRTPLPVFEEAIKKHLETNQYDIIHSTLPFEFADVYQPRGGSYKEAVIQNAVSYANPVVTAFKIITAGLNFNRLPMLKAEKKICQPGNKTIVAMLSNYVRDSFVKHYKLSADRIAVIPNGVRPHKNIDPSDVSRLRNEIMVKQGLKEADEPIFYLFVANNFRLKGLKQLIKAMRRAIIESGNQNIHLIVAGRGNAHKYKMQAKLAGIDKNILFLGQLKNIQAALRVCDVAVLPTFYDPASRFILEALTANKPVITTKLNGACDLFKEGRHGSVINTPEDIDGMTEAIKYYANKSNRDSVMQAIIADNLIENLSIERHAKQLMQLYNTIIKNKGN